MPYQFFLAVEGWNDENIERWRQARFVGWSSWVSYRGGTEVSSPEDWLKLPGDEKQIDLAKELQKMEEIRAKWKQP